MTKILEKPTFVVVLLLVLSAYLYFFQLDKIALTDPDETFYAQTAKEMVQKGEWLTPTLYGKPQFEKPVLFYWLVEASYKILASFIMGNVVLYTLGVLWLVSLYRISLVNAVRIGVLPFLAVEAVKILTAAFIYRAIADRSRSIFSEKIN